MIAGRSIGRTEIGIGLAVLVVVMLIAFALFRGSGLDAARDEVARHVESIAEYQLEYHGAFGDFVDADWAPRPPHELDARSVPWVSNAGFNLLGWAPEQDEVHGAYRTRVTPEGFLVEGVADLNGDGEQVEFRFEYVEGAEPPATATMVTDPDVY